MFSTDELCFFIALVMTQLQRETEDSAGGNGFTHKRNKRGGSVRAGEKALSEMIIPLVHGEKKKMTVPWGLLRERKGPAAI